MIFYSKHGIPKYYSATFIDPQNVLLINYEMNSNQRGDLHYDQCMITYMDNGTSKTRKEKLDIDLESYKTLIHHVEKVAGSQPNKKMNPETLPESESPRSITV